MAMAWQTLEGSLAEIDDGSFNNIWQSDFQMPHGFSIPAGDEMGNRGSADAMEPDWLDLLFDDPTILNDRMISDAFEPLVVQGEHSYSIDKSIKTETVVIKDDAADRDFEVDILGTDSSPAVSQADGQLQSGYCQPLQQQQQMESTVEWKVDAMDDSSSYYQQGSRLSPGRHTLLKHSSRHDASPSVRLHNIDIHLDVISVKSECPSQYDDGLPPTPPSSSGSDSEGGQSPQRSAPPSPSSRRSASRSLPGQASVFVCPQVNANGILLLSEEEKRTLIAEGYPIPSKLPLSKADERNLKKVRRKIKNKISAQESRRKKKEYMECLEKRMEGYSRENEGLRKKVDYLESTNRSLLGQLQKLQNLVSRVSRPAAQAAPTGTYFMVLTLFFAVFLGSWSPMSWSIGSIGTSVQLAAPDDVLLPLSSLSRPGIMQPSLDDYRVLSGHSRVMMPAQGDAEESYDDVAFGPYTPGDRNYFLGLLSNAFLSCGAASDAAVAAAVMHPDLPAIISPVLWSAEKLVSGEMAPKVLTVGSMANGSSLHLNTYTAAAATNFNLCVRAAANCTS